LFDGINGDGDGLNGNTASYASSRIEVGIVNNPLMALRPRLRGGRTMTSAFLMRDSGGPWFGLRRRSGPLAVCSDEG
jgi:hypothetical protein